MKVRQMMKRRQRVARINKLLKEQEQWWKDMFDRLVPLCAELAGLAAAAKVYIDAFLDSIKDEGVNDAI